MGSLNSSHQSPTSSTDDGLSNFSTASRLRKSKRLIEKFHPRNRASRSDLIAQTIAIDPIQSEFAQNPNRDHEATADVGECKQTTRERTLCSRSLVNCILDQIAIEARDDEESPINKNNFEPIPIPVDLKPVSNVEDPATHTNENVETESTKHNADKAVSFNSTATDETSQGDCQEQSRESSEKIAVNAEDYQKLIESVVRKLLRKDLGEIELSLRTEQGNYRQLLTDFHLFFRRWL